MTAIRERRLELGVAVLAPAAIAALLTLLVIPRPDGPPTVAEADAAHLARMAELRPIVLHGRRTVLGTGPAGPLTTASRPAEPTSLAIPSLHVDAPVESVSATAAGIEVPQIGRVGWFEAGPRPGEPGRSVLIGHLDGLRQAGVFENVPSIRTGSEIVVRDADGGVHRYAVVGKTQVPKSSFPADTVYGASKRPVLVLITCGGVWQPETGYSDNVIVYARAV
jgi:LPXTG-site transpeptidase (sortase) family protein